MTESATRSERQSERRGRRGRRNFVWAAGAGLLVLVGAAVWVGRGLDADALERLKTFNRHWVNPLMLRLVAGRILNVARLEHRGRQSGRLYATPLWADPVNEGFLIALHYGADVDWAQNLLHAGEAVLQVGDVRYRVGKPRIVPPATAQAELPALSRLVTSATGVRDFLRVDVLPAVTARIPPPA